MEVEMDVEPSEQNRILVFAPDLVLYMFISSILHWEVFLTYGRALSTK